MTTLRFDVATDADELQQIRELNYRTFVEEIPQHSPNPEQALRDRFERENTYFVCRHGDRVVGMIAVRCNRPFSLDAKLPNLDDYLPPHRSVCEIRLLAVEPGHRQTPILAGLVEMVFEFCDARGHDMALISGTLRQTKLYEHLGFQAFGPVVGTDAAPYQPMYLSLDRFQRHATDTHSTAIIRMTQRKVNLLPGPVYLSPTVKAGIEAGPVSHRAKAFTRLLARTRGMLCDLTNAPRVAVAMGSGTLANDLVAAQLTQLSGPGLVLSNGEFGRRLIDHAARVQLDFDRVEAAWGKPFDETEVRRALAHGRRKRWLWAVHAETSTGVLNDIDVLKRLANEHELEFCLDCVSSIGVVPCDLSGVTLASGVSGKGLRSMAGLALVFHGPELPRPVRPLPRYLDLRLYLEAEVPFTMSSNLVAALNLSLETLNPDERFREIREAADRLCRGLCDVGLRPLADEAVRFPGAVTIPLPHGVSSREVGDALQRRGWLLSYESDYLLARNWVQACLIGPVERDDLERLPALVAARIGAQRTGPAGSWA